MLVCFSDSVDRTLGKFFFIDMEEQNNLSENACAARYFLNPTHIGFPSVLYTTFRKGGRIAKWYALNHEYYSFIYIFSSQILFPYVFWCS